MKKFFSLMTAVLVGASLFTGCKKEDSGNTIKIGLNYELSGQVATYGRSLVEGIELAFEEINSNGGVLDKKIEAIKIDNKSEAQESANITTRLATKEKVVLILGAATSGNTKAASPVANRYKVPLVSASATADDVTVDKNGKVRDYMFKTCFSDSFQGVIMAKFAGEDLGAKKAAMLVDTSSDYSKGLADSFKKNYTGEITIEEAYKKGETDFKAVLTNIKSANPDVLFVPGYYEEVGLIIKQARELGIDVPVVGGDGYDSPKLVELAGKDALNKVYYTNHYSSKDTSEEVTKFIEDFKAKYNKEPDAFNALGYDLGYLAADAIKRAGKADPEAIKDALASTKDFKAVTGTLSMDENHNPVKSITVLEVKDGEVTFLKKLEP
ncbi:MAG: ABC transporter substrate-binding protein [Clostridia bacterium]|jgi:branched-chain amino acid transport system substrate-binding protein|nr:ABC transporter substrate-binding protein [Clostridia bacterium]